jgi:hypothetical protein
MSQPDLPVFYAIILGGFFNERIVQVSRAGQILNPSSGFDLVHPSEAELILECFKSAESTLAAPDSRGWVFQTILVVDDDSEAQYAEAYVRRGEDTGDEPNTGSVRRTDRIKEDFPRYMRLMGYLRDLVGNELPAEMKEFLSVGWEDKLPVTHQGRLCPMCDKMLVPPNANINAKDHKKEVTGILPCGHAVGAECLLHYLGNWWSPPCPIESCREKPFPDRY